MTHSIILSTCFTCLFIAACDTQGQTTHVKNEPEIKITPENITPDKIRPALDLSIDSTPVEPQTNNNALFFDEKESIQKNSALFNTLSKDKTEPKISLSGKLLTDETKLENKQYLEFIDGIQINFQGGFN